VVDGWCLSVLLNELIEIYRAVDRGQEPALPLIRPFRDYVAWLRQRDDGEAQEHWRQALRGITAPTTLGLDGLVRDRGSSQDDSFAEHEISLPSSSTAALEELGRSRRLTLSTLIQGAWALLLSRYSGRPDVLFGVTISGRPPEVAGIESMVGMFVNVLPLRVVVNEESSLVPWLRQLQANLVELRRFEAIPLARIRTWSDIPPGTQLFDSIVIVQNLPFQASLRERASNLGIEAARYHERTHYPLSLVVVPGSELVIRIAFDARRFESGAIERLLGHFQTILQAMAADPDRQILDLPSMTLSEQAQVLNEWSGSQADLSPNELDLARLSAEELDELMVRLGSGMRQES
jgi:non-ribosomal peptide synthetase component F